MYRISPSNGNVSLCACVVKETSLATSRGRRANYSPSMSIRSSRDVTFEFRVSSRQDHQDPGQLNALP